MEYPFVRLANVLIWGRDEQAIKSLGNEFFSDIKKRLRERGCKVDDLSSYGLRAFKAEGVWRYHLLIKAGGG